MKKLISVIISLVFFTVICKSQPLFQFEHNQVTNNTYNLDLNLFEEGSYSLNHYISFWDIDEPRDTLGKLYNYIEIGFSANLELIRSALNSKFIIGLGNGNYHSGGGEFLSFESISVGAEFGYKISDKINWLFSGKSSFHLRNGKGLRPLTDRYLWNLSLYYIFNKVDLGIMYEQYVLTQQGILGKNTFSKYVWLGPVLSIRLLKNKLTIKSSLGVDLIDYIDTYVKEADKNIKEFYKLQIDYYF